jgi:hypothetical protein
MNLTTANSNIVPQQFDGFYQQQYAASGSVNANYYINNDYVYDCRGNSLRDSVFQDTATQIVENWGDPDTVFGPPAVFRDYALRFEGGKRFMADSEAGNLKGGERAMEVYTQYGNLKLVTDKFMRQPVPKTTSSNATSPKAPTAPSTVTAAAVADATNQYSGFTGDYMIGVTAVNRYGESPITVTGSAVVVASGDSVDITITPAASTIPATGYNIYKSMLNVTTGTVQYYYLFSVSAAQVAAGYDGGAAGVVREKNYFLPNTERAFICERSTNLFAFKQLAPLMKMDLAVIAPSTRFMILLYGTPILYAPKKMNYIINIGTNIT